MSKTSKKYSEEKVLYFAHKEGQFHVNRTVSQKTNLQSVIQKALNEGLLSHSSRQGINDWYAITRKGEKRLKELQMAYKARKELKDAPPVIKSGSQKTMASAPPTSTKTKSAGAIQSGVDRVALMNVTLLRAIAKELDEYGVISVDHTDPSLEAILNTGWFNALGSDDAGIYITRSSLLAQSPGFSELLSDPNITWDALISALPRPDGSEELPLAFPASLDEYRKAGVAYLTKQVEKGEILSSVIDGISDLYWDVSYDEKKPLPDAIEQVLAARDYHQQNSPEQHRIKQKQLYDLLLPYAQSEQKSAEYDILPLSVLASKELGRAVRFGDVDHVLRQIRSEQQLTSLLALAATFKEDCAMLEPSQQHSRFALLAESHIGRKVSVGESEHLLDNAGVALSEYEPYVAPVSRVALSPANDTYREEHNRAARQVISAASSSRMKI